MRPAPGRTVRRREQRAPWTIPRALAIPAFVAVFVYVAMNWSFRPIVVLAYALASLVTFIAYALDKSAAVDRRWRIPESTLHALSLACGWPGALLAQQFMRHKTSKTSFLAGYWATAVINVAGFVIVHSPLVSGVLV